METNDLKKYVENNRTAFEVYDYDADDWQEISSRLDQSNRERKSVNIPLRYVWRVAAIVLLMLGSAFYMSWTNWNQQSNGMMMSAELQEAEYYYNNLIATKVQEISRIDQDVSQAVFQDMAIMDQVFTELKNDLKDNADNEEVINAMIDNYKIKLEILEQILEQLEEKQSL